MKNVLVLLLSLAFVPNFAFAQAKLKSANIIFFTPQHTDDKDWNTQVSVTLHLSDGTIVGTTNGNSCTSLSTDADISKCFCCAFPLFNEHSQVVNAKTLFIDDGTERGPFPINISIPVTKQSITTGYFEVSISPVGHDRWIFVPKLDLKFDDNTSVIFDNYQNTVVSQDAAKATFIFYNQNNSASKSLLTNNKLIGTWKVVQVGVDINGNGKIDPDEISPIDPSLDERYSFESDMTGTLTIADLGSSKYRWSMSADNNDITMTDISNNTKKVGLARMTPPSTSIFHIEKLDNSSLNLSSMQDGEFTVIFMSKVR